MRAIRGMVAWSGLAVACALAAGCGKWKSGPTRADVARAIAASTAPDGDGDGLPDAWEQALIAAAGGGKTLADIRPDGDEDGDGLPDLNPLFNPIFVDKDGKRIAFVVVGARGAGVCA